MSIGRPLGAKLFLEGIEVPFIGASITHTVNQAAISYVDIVPHESINNIKPRTLVHLFVKDSTNSKKGFPYVLAFEGEVFGINFSKTPTSRSMSLSCIDLSSYWDNVLTYFFNAQQSLGKGAGSMASVGQDIQGAKAQGQKVASVTHSVSSYFIKIIQKELAKGPTSTGRERDFLDGLVAVFKEIGGINDFYNNAEDRLRITDKIKLRSSGKLTELLKEKEGIDWFQGLIGRTSGYQTLRSVVQNLMSIIFHDFVSIPFPALVDHPAMGDKGSAVLWEKPKPPKTIASFIFKPNMYMLPPPMCNVFYPDEYSSFSYNRNFFQEPTRLIYKPELPLYGGGTPVHLPHVWVPASFKYFMENKSTANIDDELVGDGALQVESDPGKFDSDIDNVTSGNKKREGQFLTNEENLKGILMAQETMIPGTSQFRVSLDKSGRKDLHEKVADYLFFKKRFEGRSLQITSHLKMSVVPGFTVMVLDDSDAGQNVLAYCDSVTHRIYCNQGGYTNTTLSYARTVDEQDQTSGKSGEPLVPPWFDEVIFGKKEAPPTSNDETIDKAVSEAGDQNVVPDALSEFYRDLLGNRGYKTINTYTKEQTALGSAKKLVKNYKTARESGPESVHLLVDDSTRRAYANINTTYAFLFAYSKTKDYDTPFLQFNGTRLSGVGAGDEKQVQSRKDVIIEYRNILKKSRGFRG